MSEGPIPVHSDDPYVVRVWHGVEGTVMQWALFGFLIVAIIVLLTFISRLTTRSFSNQGTPESETTSLPDESRMGVLRSVSELSRSEPERSQEEKLQVLEALSETAGKNSMTEKEKLELLQQLKGI